jgi:hypothetical protein
MKNHNFYRYTFEVAPAFTLIENKVLSHVLKLFGIPDGDGIFSPGGSLSMLYGIVAARFKAFPQVKTKGMWGLPHMVLYTSEDVSVFVLGKISYRHDRLKWPSDLIRYSLNSLALSKVHLIRRRFLVKHP